MTTSRSFTWTSDDEPGRAFPSGATYVEALQNTQLCFRGTDLAGADVRVDALGRPRAISGNFASVFSVTAADGTRYAVKCFTREVREQAARYRAIGAHLAGLADGWTVGFDYLDKGIMVEGAWFPVLRMEWVEGVGLIRWIERNTANPAALSGLADRFATLVADLAAAGVGHGDLQHGNILVDEDGALRLVDYDGVYVPALAGLPAVETGHRNYQSPDRTAADFGPEVDRFSSWVVYLSLVALTVDPALWHQLRDEDAENLLLAESDFTDPANSFRLATLTGHPDPRLRGLAGRFRDVLLHHRAAPPPLEPLGPLDVAEVAVPGSAALPSWVAERVQGHMPAPLPQARFAGRTPLPAALTWLLAVLLPLGVPAALFLEPAVAGLDLAAVLAWAGATAADYRRRPEVPEARAARAERKRLHAARQAAAARTAWLDRETWQAARAADKLKAEQDRRRHALQQRHNERRAAHQQAVRQRLDRIDRERQASATRAHLEAQRLLALRQKEHLRAYLARFPIRTAGIEGIGQALTANLAAVGIRTAADFVGVSYATIGNTRVAAFVLADGRAVRAAGIGAVKTGRVDQWRANLTTIGAGNRPTALDPAEHQAIRDRFAAERAALDVEYQAERERAEVATRELQAALRAEQVDLAESLKAANTSTARSRVDHDRLVAEAAVVLDRAHQAVADSATRADAYRGITYGHYLRFLLTGRT
ncbi:hypothetical protein ABZ816_17735 [Actinosynnema sp. NPDC047251]|uniref:Protein kinase domain-containing protein n=1 Tax=Saccharothrix espanaensis (strain ATCC 51144 / DSM 44229 / JCM 9112 / NBRC 15066 / NRRL 15764) TaxID=1179773 RepID=K0K110_SACES|nr:hypothetical protein [Saccharothrix espanaensis]CCH30263.1 hypothetical protein BN6_29530 [Saccharothrix espanaensis DSM 44229]